MCRRRAPWPRAALATPWLQFNPVRLMNDNKGVFGVNVGHLWEEIDRVTSWMERLLELYCEGALRPVVAARVPLERAAEAHRAIEGGKTTGKLVLTAD